MTEPSRAARRRPPFLFWSLPLLLVAALARAAEAAEERSVVVEDLEAGSFVVGDRVSITGQYLELQDDRVVIFECQAEFRISDGRLRRELLAATAESPVVTLSATCASSGPPTAVFRIDAIRKAPPLQEALEADIAALSARGADAAPLLFRLARRIHRTEEKLGGSDLRPLAWKASAAALAARNRALPADDVASRLEDVRQMHELFPDREFTMRVLAELEKRYPTADAVRSMLIQLRCRKFRGQWMTWEDFKKRQGFEPRGEEWVTPRERDFLDTIAAYEKLREQPILRRRLDEEYHLHAARGKVEIGMNRHEVYRALGYPDRVYRKEIPGHAVDQWVFGDRYFYFLDGLLLEHPDDETALKQ